MSIVVLSPVINLRAECQMEFKVPECRKVASATNHMKADFISFIKGPNVIISQHGSCGN